jgi:uncharacterized phage protein (TIGR01671 family)
MREIKFRAWAYKVTNNRADYAYSKAQIKDKEPNKGTEEWDVWYDKSQEYYDDFLEEWDSLYKKEDTITKELVMCTNFSINGKISHSYGYEIIEVMQFTGLKDKNSKEIFENDIVKCGYGVGKVVYNSGCFMIEWLDDKEVYMEFLFSRKGVYTRTKDEELEVIGNIYENNVTNIIYDYINYGK